MVLEEFTRYTNNKKEMRGKSDEILINETLFKDDLVLRWLSIIDYLTTTTIFLKFSIIDQFTRVRIDSPTNDESNPSGKPITTIIPFINQKSR